MQGMVAGLPEGALCRVWCGAFIGCFYLKKKIPTVKIVGIFYFIML
jgi:hypothetical protein